MRNTQHGAEIIFILLEQTTSAQNPDSTNSKKGLLSNFTLDRGRETSLLGSALL